MVSSLCMWVGRLDWGGFCIKGEGGHRGAGDLREGARDSRSFAKHIVFLSLHTLLPLPRTLCFLPPSPSLDRVLAPGPRPLQSAPRSTTSPPPMTKTRRRTRMTRPLLLRSPHVSRPRRSPVQSRPPRSAQATGTRKGGRGDGGKVWGAASCIHGGGVCTRQPGSPARPPACLPHSRDLHAVQKHDVTAHEITPADDDDEEEEEEDMKGARRRNRRAA